MGITVAELHQLGVALVAAELLEEDSGSRAAEISLGPRGSSLTAERFWRQGRRTARIGPGTSTSTSTGTSLGSRTRTSSTSSKDTCSSPPRDNSSSHYHWPPVVHQQQPEQSVPLGYRDSQQPRGALLVAEMDLPEEQGDDVALQADSIQIGVGISNREENIHQMMLSTIRKRLGRQQEEEEEGKEKVREIGEGEEEHQQKRQRRQHHQRQEHPQEPEKPLLQQWGHQDHSQQQHARQINHSPRLLQQRKHVQHELLHPIQIPLHSPTLQPEYLQQPERRQQQQQQQQQPPSWQRQQPSPLMQHEQQGPLQHEQLKLLHRGGPPLRGGAGPLAAALPSASGAVAADAEPEACLPDLQWQATRHLQEGPSFIAASGSVQEGIAASNSQCSPTHQGGMKQRSTTPPPALPKREAIAITNVSGSNDSSTLLSTICCTSLYPTLDALQQRHHHRTDAIMSTGRNQIEQAEPAAAPRTVSVRTHDCRFISHIRQPLGDPHAQHQALNMAGDRSLVGLHKTLEEQRLNSEGDRIGSMAAGVEKLQQPKDEKYEQGGLDSAHGLLADIIVRQLIEDEMERKRHRQQLMLNVDDGINGLSSQRDHRIFEKVTHAGERKVDMGAKEGLSVMGKEAVVAAEEERLTRGDHLKEEAAQEETAAGGGGAAGSLSESLLCC